MPGILIPFISEPLKHLMNLVTRPEYFTYHRLATQLRWQPRYKPFKVRLNNWILDLPDSASFLTSYKAIFVDQIYSFAFEGNSPRILDLGSNVGLSVLYFKRSFPAAEIVALEPDPTIYAFLERNVYGNGYRDVELYRNAAWTENTRLSYSSQGGDAGRVVETGMPGALQVDGIDLREILSQRNFDFIKMDIEGSEKIVLPICQPFLSEVRYLFVEFHSWAGKPQGLAQVIDILSDSGYRLSLKEVWANPKPFLEHIDHPEGFDFQANIFAWRE